MCRCVELPREVEDPVSTSLASAPKEVGQSVSEGRARPVTRPKTGENQPIKGLLRPPTPEVQGMRKIGVSLLTTKTTVTPFTNLTYLLYNTYNI